MKSPTPSRLQKVASIPACTFLCFAALSVQAEETSVAPQPPDILLGPLFNDVQNTKLFPGQGTFADAVLDNDPLVIPADYRMQQNQSGFDLRHFVNVNFILPKEGGKYAPPEGQLLREHVDGLWPVLTRSTENTEKQDSLLPLPEPYVVPSGRFRKIYYWGSYFTMLGLTKSGYWDKAANMVASFTHEIDTYGHIPDGNRSYYLSRSQPPFPTLMVELLAQHEGGTALKQYLPQMQKEYAYWMDDVKSLQTGRQEKRVAKLQDGTLLNCYWDDRDTPRPESQAGDIATAESDPNRPATEIYRDLRSTAASGWDFSSRWMNNPQQLNTLHTTSIVSVDLSGLMFKMEKVLAHASKATGDSAMADQYETLANVHQKGTEEYLWSDQQNWYIDYNLKSHKIRSQLTAATLFPLYVNAVARDHASKVATATKTHLLRPGGLNTTSVRNGQQRDTPDDWAPLQWVATEGLQNYGQKGVAMGISWHFLTNVQHTYDREKKLVKECDVNTTRTGGGGDEYPLQDGFGWTNSMTLKMLDLICPKERPYGNAPTTRPLSESTTRPLKQKEVEPTP